MKRAAVYARFSSEKQNERSCRDQIDLCRAWAGRRGDMIVVSEYTDEAVSGASTVNRLGLARMMRDAHDGAFDVVICEALDRLSRDQADLATIKKRLGFLEIGIATVADGDVGAIHIGLKGLMGELFLADLAAKTKRGQGARVKAGASGGGKSYGYDPVPGRPGELTINEAEAAIVRRVFEEYARGDTPREIAGRLNRDGIPGPRGGQWNASTLNGSRQRANGLLNNRLYIGEIVWNRQRFVKDPATGNRVSRLNPEADWVRVGAPHLAIIPTDLWRAAETRRAGFAGHPTAHARRPRHMLTGLLRCACCGGGATIISRDRIGCSAAREKGTCSNRKTIARAEVERRVLGALHAVLGDPELVAAYVREYHAERSRLTKAAKAQMGEKRTRLEALLKSIDRGIAAMLDGTAPDGLGPRVKAMEAEAALLRREMEESQPASAVMHPKAAAQYAELARDLAAYLAGEGVEVAEQARVMLETVTIGPGGMHVTGRLPPEGVTALLVAGTRNSQCPTFTVAA